MTFPSKSTFNSEEAVTSEKHPIGALDEHTVRLTGDPKPEMIVGQVIDAVMRQDAMTGRELNTGYPFLGANPITNGILRFDESHGQ